MATWQRLNEFLESHVLPEERMYRGETNVRMKDLEALFDTVRAGDPDSGAAYTTDERVLSGRPDPHGGSADVNFPVDPRVWGRWARTPDTAAIFSTTRDDQYPGSPRGGTVMKRAHGGRVFYQAGPRSTSHEQMPSAMDRYDVMMVGDVQGGAVPTKGVTTSQGLGGASIFVRRIAWSPAIGSTEERQRRLQALLGGGQAGPLRRRPQPASPTAPNPGRKDDPTDPKHDKFRRFQTQGAGRTAPMPDDPQDAERFGTAGRLGLGGKPRHKKSRDED